MGKQFGSCKLQERKSILSEQGLKLCSIQQAEMNRQVPKTSQKLRNKLVLVGEQNVGRLQICVPQSLSRELGDGVSSSDSSRVEETNKVGVWR